MFRTKHLALLAVVILVVLLLIGLFSVTQEGARDTAQVTDAVIFSASDETYSITPAEDAVGDRNAFIQKIRNTFVHEAVPEPEPEPEPQPEPEPEAIPVEVIAPPAESEVVVPPTSTTGPVPVTAQQPVATSSVTPMPAYVDPSI